MAGILANSVSATMVSGDTSPDNTATGYISAEQITLTTFPTATTYAWVLSSPSGSSGAKCFLVGAAEASATFTPDVEGVYVVTCVTDAASYVIRLTVLKIASTGTTQAMRLSSTNSAQIPTPAPAAVTLFFPSGAAVLAIKDSDGDVHPLATVGGEDASFGELYAPSPDTVSLGVRYDYYEIDIPMTLSAGSQFTATGADGRMTYTGATTARFQLNAHASLSASSNNHLYRMCIMKNGVPHVPSIQSRFVATGADVGAVGLGGCLELATGDYLSVCTADWSGTSTLTVEHLHMTAIQAF